MQREGEETCTPPLIPELSANGEKEPRVVSPNVHDVQVPDICNGQDDNNHQLSGDLAGEATDHVADYVSGQPVKRPGNRGGDLDDVPYDTYNVQETPDDLSGAQAAPSHPPPNSICRSSET